MSYRFSDLPEPGRFDLALCAAYATLGLGVKPRRDLNIFGIRSENRRAALFDDAIVAWLPEGNRILSRPLLRCFPATTDPGRHWLRQPMRPEGCAVLPPGHYPDFWKLGTHRGYLAFQMDAASVPGWRDNDFDDVIDPDTAKLYPISAINGHHAGAASITDWASAGCQVTPEPEDLAALLWFAREDQRALGLGVNYRVDYTLFDVARTPASGAMDALLACARQKAPR